MMSRYSIRSGISTLAFGAFLCWSTAALACEGHEAKSPEGEEPTLTASNDAPDAHHEEVANEGHDCQHGEMASEKHKCPREGMAGEKHDCPHAKMTGEGHDANHASESEGHASNDMHAANEGTEHASHDSHAGHEGGHHVHPFHVALFLGAVTAEELTAPSLGLDFEYRLPFAHRMLGVVAFTEFAFEEEAIAKLAGVGVMIHPALGFKVLLGAGVEMIGEESEALLRGGLAYDIHLGRFSITPTLAADYVQKNLAMVYGIELGAGF